MSTDLPAMRRFKNDLLLVESNPLVAWLSTELAPAFGKGAEWDPFVEIVADVEAEGNALIGGVQCPRPHGVEDPEGNVVPGYDLLTDRVYGYGFCPDCGAAL